MAEDVNVQDVNLDETEPVMGADDYVANINKLKQNTVPREQYEQLLKEKKVLADAVLEGEQIANENAVPEPTTKEKQERQKELRNIIFDTKTDKSNLELAKDILEFRDLTIELDGPESDPFLPVGTNIDVTQNDLIGAKKVADTFKHCIDASNGDSEFFTNELQRLTKDSMPMYRDKKNRR